MTTKKKSDDNKKKTLSITKFLTDKEIRLKVSCSKDGWELLRKEYFDVGVANRFEDDFYSHFIRSAMDQIYKPKNLHNNHSFLLMMKAQAAILYLFFKPYFEYQKKMEKYPGRDFIDRLDLRSPYLDYDVDIEKLLVFMQKNGLPYCYVLFDRFIAIIKNIRSSLWRIPGNKHTPALYVAYCMQTVYKFLIDEMGIKYFLEPLDSLPWSESTRVAIVSENVSSFYKTYISKGVRLFKEHLEINAAHFQRYKNLNHIDRFSPDIDTPFGDSVRKLYAFHHSKIEPEHITNISIFVFVNHLLHSMLFILSNRSATSLTPEEIRICQFLFDLFGEARNLIPYRYGLTNDEQFILALARDKLYRL